MTMRDRAVSALESLFSDRAMREQAADKVLLAALDPEDKALVEALAKAHWNGTPATRMTVEPTTSSTRPYEWKGSPVLWDDSDMSESDCEATRRGVRASIAFLNQTAQGERSSQEQVREKD